MLLFSTSAKNEFLFESSFNLYEPILILRNEKSTVFVRF